MDFLFFCRDGSFAFAPQKRQNGPEMSILSNAARLTKKPQQEKQTHNIKMPCFSGVLALAVRFECNTNLNLLSNFQNNVFDGLASHQNLGQIRVPKSQSGTWIYVPKLLFEIKVAFHLTFDRKTGLGK